MGCAALGPSYKWLFLSFSGHSEDKSLMLKVFWFRGSGRNSSITAAEQRNISDMFLPSDGSIRGLVLYLFSSRRSQGRVRRNSAAAQETPVLSRLRGPRKAVMTPCRVRNSCSVHWAR